MKLLLKCLFKVCFLIILCSGALTSQTRIAIMGVDTLGERKFIKLSTNDRAILKEVPSFTVSFFAGNRKFNVIDRKNQRIVQSEKELQKSEDFIDGYMVDQGKSEGVDLIFKPFYNARNSTLLFKIYDIATETVRCTYEKKLNSGFFGGLNLDGQLRFLLHEFAYDCLEIQFPVVRHTKSSPTQAKILLVAIGKSNKIKEGDELEIFQYSVENIDGEEVKRKVVIGTAEINKINDENFSDVKVGKGGQEILRALNSNTKLFTRIIKS